MVGDAGVLWLLGSPDSAIAACGFAMWCVQTSLCTLVIKMITCNFLVFGNYFSEDYNYNYNF